MTFDIFLIFHDFSMTTIFPWLSITVGTLIIPKKMFIIDQKNKTEVQSQYGYYNDMVTS